MFASDGTLIVLVIFCWATSITLTPLAVPATYARLGAPPSANTTGDSGASIEKSANSITEYNGCISQRYILTIMIVALLLYPGAINCASTVLVSAMSTHSDESDGPL